MTPTPDTPNPTPEEIARRFHEAYERLAPDYGYKTREASAVPWEEVPEANRMLMVATVSEVMAGLLGGDQQEPSAPANPLATSGERVRNQTDSSHVAPQEPSPVASTPTVSDDSGHGGDDDRGGREDGPEDEGRSHQATVAGTPQRPSGCAECHRFEGHKMDCSHRHAPSPDREKLIAELEFRSGKRAFPGETGYDQSHLDLMGVAAAALAAQPVLDPEKVAEAINTALDAWEGEERSELFVARALCEAAKRGELT